MIVRTIAASIILTSCLTAQGFGQNLKRTSPPSTHKTRTYYLAAEDVNWDYAPSGQDLIDGMPLPLPWRGKTVWAKTRYIEYTDDTFSTRKPQPEWLGILGPVIRAVVGDEIEVHFLNRAMRDLSIHPHGLRYDKDNEGARYVRTGAGGDIPPGGKFTYHWFVDPGSGPGPGDPSSVVWWYHSHVDAGVEINAGLLGPIVITAAEKARPDMTPKDVDREFVTMFMIFDERGIKDIPGRRNDPQVNADGLFYTINGYIFGNLPGLVMKQGENVRWYLLGMGDENDLHTPHWHGKTVLYHQRHTDVVELLPASMASADMIADNPGNWMFHCHVSDHMESGMMASYTIVALVTRSCPVKLGAGEFWDASVPSHVEVTNTSGKAIRRLALHAGYFQNTVQNLNPVPYEWLWMDPTPPNETRILNLTEDRFKSAGMGRYSEDKSVLGLIFFPGRIEYADGSVWAPRPPGECFRAYWRDPDHSLPFNALPPFQLGEEEQEDVN